MEIELIPDRDVADTRALGAEKRIRPFSPDPDEGRRRRFVAPVLEMRPVGERPGESSAKLKRTDDEHLILGTGSGRRGNADIQRLARRHTTQAKSHTADER